MTESTATVIQQIIAPATMIPACGLLLLSSTARMNTVLARVRAFHHERLQVWKKSTEAGSREHAVRELRLEGLEHQTHRLLGRIRLLRITMLQLFVAIACNLFSVIGLALRFVVADAGGTICTASVSVFVVGIVVMLGAMVTSIVEVFRITETVVYEHERVERLCNTDPDKDATVMDAGSGEGVGL